MNHACACLNFLAVTFPPSSEWPPPPPPPPCPYCVYVIIRSPSPKVLCKYVYDLMIITLKYSISENGHTLKKSERVLARQTNFHTLKQTVMILWGAYGWVSNFANCDWSHQESHICCQHFAGSSININRSWPSFQFHNLTWKCIHILALINSKHFGIYHMSEFQVLGNQDWTFAIILRQTAVLAFVRRIAKILCRGFYIPVCYCQHYLEWVILT